MAFFDKLKNSTKGSKKIANKKILRASCLLLSIVLLCSVFAGCGNDEPTTENNTAQLYIDMAQDYIKSGNYAAAIDVLEKGYVNTGDAQIKDFLQEVVANQSTQPTNPSVSTAPAASSPEITPPSTIPPTTTPSATIPPTTAPSATIPPTTTPPNTSTFLNTHSGSITISSANISLQDSAVLYVTLSYSGSVSYSCDPSNIVTLQWGEFDYNNTAPLFITASQNGSARIRIFETNYPNNYLTINVTVSNHFDLSKASGILAQAGLTEQGFRDICTYIGSQWQDDNEYAIAAGREYYEQHSEEADDISYYASGWYDFQINGTRSDFYASYKEELLKECKTAEEYVDRALFGPKGARILGDRSKEIMNRMKEYPADYLNQAFLLKSFRTTYVNNYTYTDDAYVIYDVDTCVVDYRDDPNYPKMLQGYRYDMYVIFKGLNTYGDLLFALISVEKCS